MIDQTDMEIIKLLTQNSRMQWQDIGEKVHLTGQAVKNRVDRLEKLGVIEGYTVKLNQDKLGMEIKAFVTVFMKTTDHASFKKYLMQSDLINEAYRISGEGCYLLQVNTTSQKELLTFLDGVLKYGNYRVNLSIDKIK
ncbi:Lrp/AsnC family transcriptional regulator [Pseudobacteroides cellulosolvens]|uniref:Transcriptional regulator, AsnC family n=1 Tax=Pseudobacteroides cellulosolvens ATCC 35603 = DSM 2933 TaxID=398512 RepID=A0A0L6JGQ8_9FIRM|nr:Lrp/AsnC family transcriptional regulator [Pseudobacteroides cellulosolvens]KNY24885.1 transcriptional regulator, AsnC family [Pseudobacteroides cellulosolvens ATCC 35603 = DSM 2933]